MSPVLILSGLVLGAALVAPFATARKHHGKRPGERENGDDRAGRQQDRAYRVYLGEQQREYRGFGRMSREDQEHYFRWRESHPDH